MTTDPPQRARPVGVRDVAHRAGVSTQTVSRVINARPGIRDETRQRVLEAMAELGYRVNNAARALGTRRTRTLGVIASDATLYGPSIAISELEAAARGAGLWIATAYADAAVGGSVEEALQHVLAQGVDGVIVVAPHTGTVAQMQARELDVPLTAMHSGTGAEGQVQGAALAVDHLVELGHRRIARLGGPPDWVEERLRHSGFDGAMASHRLAATHRWEGDWSAAAGQRLCVEIVPAVRAPGGPTAVVVANDQMALGLIAGLAAAGIRVPEDVSVTGFDDNPDAAFYRPALTTIRLDLAGEAERCIAEVTAGHRAPSGRAAPRPAPPRLVARASTAPR